MEKEERYKQFIKAGKFVHRSVVYTLDKETTDLYYANRNQINFIVGIGKGGHSIQVPIMECIPYTEEIPQNYSEEYKPNDSIAPTFKSTNLAKEQPTKEKPKKQKKGNPPTSKPKKH
jgi:hypothetical protein